MQLHQILISHLVNHVNMLWWHENMPLKYLFACEKSKNNDYISCNYEQWARCLNSTGYAVYKTNWEWFSLLINLRCENITISNNDPET